MNILGISAYYHDSAACLIQNGEIIAAAQEERFSREKNTAAFPAQAIKYCLNEGNIDLTEIDYIAFYDKPLLKFERILETYLEYAPKGLNSFLVSMPSWIKQKLFLPNILQNNLNDIFPGSKHKNIKWIDKMFFPNHHLSHAASAFFPSPFKSAAILTIDGVGEWATTVAGIGNENSIKQLYEIHFPHSMGLLYSAFTSYLGFEINSGEYKLMGLAAYGKTRYTKLIFDHLIDLKEDGSFNLNMDYFDFCIGFTMTNNKFNELFGGPPRKPGTKITQREMDLARSIQDVTEEVIKRMAKFIKKITGENNLCLAGGVALNSVANGKLLKDDIFKNIWIQPAAGDAGGALGAALCVWHLYLNKNKITANSQDTMKGSYLGPSYSNEYIETFLTTNNVPFSKLNEDELVEKTADLLSEGKVIGWFQGRMEFGPRALGARSILGDARNNKMQSIMNSKIKYRESFRPLAPSVLREKASEYFDLKNDSPYMLIVSPVIKEGIPAVTHVDYSARIQTVDKYINPRYYKLISKFEKNTGYAVIANTSFNIKGEPIVCSPEDAYKCFLYTEMDYLIIENFILDKNNLNKIQIKENTLNLQRKMSCGIYLSNIRVKLKETLSKINNYIVLSVAFYSVLVPIGIIRKAYKCFSGNSENKTNNSYWIKTAINGLKDEMKRTF